MLSRPLAMAGMLGAAVGVPYVVTEGPNFLPNQAPQATSSAAPPAAATNEQPAAIDTRLGGPGSEIYRSIAPVEGYQGLPLEALLRWEITKEWVYSHWDRKSTGLAEPGLFGVRAPIVTGDQMTDLAGSISYYFDAQGVLQKIRVRGTTADTSQLVQMAAYRWGMQRRTDSIAGNQLYQASEEQHVRAELRTHPAAVLWSTSPHGSFRVDLELNRPGSNHWVTERFYGPKPSPPQTLQQAQAAAQQEAPAEQTPIFPARAVVPDADAAEAVEQSRNSAVPSTTVSNSTPIDEEGGEALAQPSSDIAPLESYRDRFRWPN